MIMGIASRKGWEGWKGTWSFDSSEEGVVGFVFDDALEIKREFAGMVVAPHGGLTAGNFAA